MSSGRVDPRTPILVGVGQISDAIDRPGYRQLSPVGLAASCGQICADRYRRRSGRLGGGNRHGGWRPPVRDLAPGCGCPTWQVRQLSAFGRDADRCPTATGHPGSRRRAGTTASRHRVGRQYRRRTFDSRAALRIRSDFHRASFCGHVKQAGLHRGDRRRSGGPRLRSGRHSLGLPRQAWGDRRSQPLRAVRERPTGPTGSEPADLCHGTDGEPACPVQRRRS